LKRGGLLLLERPSRGGTKTRGRTRGECEEDGENMRTRQETQGEDKKNVRMMRWKTRGDLLVFLGVASIGPCFSATLDFGFATYDDHPAFSPHFRALLSRSRRHPIVSNVPTTRFGSRSSHDHSHPFSLASQSLPGCVML